MAIVQVRGSLQSLTTRPAAVPAPSAFDSPSPATYAAIFRTQPQVRTVVSFLARNVADLNVHVYRRISDTDRERLVDHELAVWLASPNPGKTRYRMVEDLMSDMGIYFNAYWLKVRAETRMFFVRVPSETIVPDGWLLPSSFEWTLPDGTTKSLAPRDVVHFNGYDPCNPLMGLSPLETLRGLLAEEANTSAYRRQYFANSSRVEGVITRPKDLPKWTKEQKQEFREQWQLRYAGPANAGGVAVLEDGMTFQATSYSPREAEFTDARKLSREEVARAYHVPLPMVGILDHATFSNIREQHKNLYQDCLGPWLTMLQEEFERQILPECDDQQGVYTEFNIDQKLKGSFEEQAAALQTLVGRPVLTLNEGRGRLNLPSIKDDPTADKVAQPLYLTTSPGSSQQSQQPGYQPGRALGRAHVDPLVEQARAARHVEADTIDAEGFTRGLTRDFERFLLDRGVEASTAARVAEREANAELWFLSAAWPDRE